MKHNNAMHAVTSNVNNVNLKHNNNECQNKNRINFNKHIMNTCITNQMKMCDITLKDNDTQ